MYIGAACGEGIPTVAYAALAKKKIKEIKDLQNWTRDEIANLCGVGRKTMELLEKGMSSAGIEWSTEPHKKKAKVTDAVKESNTKCLESFANKQTKWEGLWWNPSTNYFSSAKINLKQLRDFKGTVRMYVRKNLYYNGGENGRPNYVFSFRDADAMNELELRVEDMDGFPTKSNGYYYDENGSRLYTHNEVQTAINGAVADAQCGYTDVIVEDYV